MRGPAAADQVAAAGLSRSGRAEQRGGGPPHAGRGPRRGPPAVDRPFHSPSPGRDGTQRRSAEVQRHRYLGASRVDPRRFVVGTAGHIDHGKTALVKALTGVDTDRWEEEKRRGITIDLGFAPLDLGDGLDASLVDVPGHEGFVRNMLAGATGIDLALLVIAADEGIMPQTEEHLAIVELLGIGRGVPVITKRDLVDDDWLALVRADVIARLERSPVRWAAPVAVSALAGSGLDELRDVWRATAQELTERPSDDLYRLPIDRVFAVAGAGTVVTGSTWSGTLAVGDSVRLLPLDRDVRVRSIEIHGRPATQALPGRRTALALVGVDKGELTRGDVAVAGEGWRATTRIDAAVSLLTPTAAGSARAGRGGGAGGIGARKPLTNRTRVRVHLGTAEVLARVSGAVNIPPGGSGTVRLVLEQPLVARGGDRFVLRSFSPVTTIGGGVVLDPFSPTSSRQSRVLGAGGKPADRVVAWTEATGLLGIRIAELPVRLGVTPASVSAVID